MNKSDVDYDLQDEYFLDGTLPPREVSTSRSAESRKGFVEAFEARLDKILAGEEAADSFLTTLEEIDKESLAEYLRNEEMLDNG